jgi:hypothetical protein
VAIYVYKNANGALLSWCPDDSDPVAPPAELAAQGNASKSGLPPLGPTVAWDEATKTTKTVVAPTPANPLNTFDFINAFTPLELANIRGATTDNPIQQFLFSLQCTQGVNLNATSIANSLQYLVNKGLLTQNRANTILATTSSGTAGSQ